MFIQGYVLSQLSIGLIPFLTTMRKLQTKIQGLFSFCFHFSFLFPVLDFNYRNATLFSIYFLFLRSCKENGEKNLIFYFYVLFSLFPSHILKTRKWKMKTKVKQTFSQIFENSSMTKTNKVYLAFKTSCNPHFLLKFYYLKIFLCLSLYYLKDFFSLYKLNKHSPIYKFV